MGELIDGNDACGAEVCGGEGCACEASADSKTGSIGMSAVT